ncbi:MAG: YihY/virulence factor BrkB family protein [Oscillospiraceae bacterium]|nr:YihY/virulence factor BrkB family protein [Oscillospiraceae bacterium]
MKEIPKGGLIGKIYHTVRALEEKDIPIHAANASFFIVLAVFPALLLLLGILRYTPLDVHALIGVLEGVLPAALLPEAEKLILNTYQSTSGMVISLSAVATLWSASRGIYGLLTGLNAVYETSEDRGYLYTRSISVVYTFLFFLVLLLTLVLHVFGSALVGALESLDNPLMRLLTGIIDLRFFLLLAVQTAVFTAIFTVLPNRKNRPSESLPGALLAAIGWQVFSHVYSLYVDHFPSYANIYGSVYAVALSMLWLYCCISILFYGGALNYLIKNRENA